MAKQVSYLKQIVPHLEKKFGREKSSRIMERGLKRYDELVEENQDEPKAYYTHTRQRIYPGIAMFEAMLAEGIDRKEAADFLIGYSGWRAKKMAPIIKTAFKLPGLYKIVPKVFYNMTLTQFGPHMGFAMEDDYLAKDEMHFNMVKCPYQDTCVKYGCPEIVRAYCDGDDILYGDMHKKLTWDRTKTLGHGDSVCDFKIRVLQ